jgi:hypothetical protein
MESCFPSFPIMQNNGKPQYTTYVRWYYKSHISLQMSGYFILGENIDWQQVPIW